MFKALVEKIILSQLSGFIQDLDSEQLHVNLLNGKIELGNIKLDPRILLKLKLPLILKHSKIEKINVVIPWSALTTQSVQITIEGVYALLVPFPKHQWNYNTQDFVEKIKEKLARYEVEWEIEKEKQKMPEEVKVEKNSYFDGLKEKVLKNLKVKILNLHFRYEDNYKKCNYSMGVNIESICMSSDLDVKDIQGSSKLEISNFSVYLNAQDTHYTDFNGEIVLNPNQDKIVSCKPYIVSTNIVVFNENNSKRVKATIEHLQFEYTHLQYIHTIRFCRKYSKYTKFLSNQ